MMKYFLFFCLLLLCPYTSIAQEDPVTSPFYMDRSQPFGNSVDIDSRRALHVKIKNTALEPIAVSMSGSMPSLVKIFDSAGTALFSTGNALDVNIKSTGVTQPVSGTLTCNAGSGTLLVDGSAHTQPISGSVSVSNFPATQAVTQSTSPWIVNGSGFTQPVSGPLTDTQLRATPVPVSGTFFQSIQPVSQSGTWTVQQGSPPWSVSQSGAWSVTANAGTNLNTSALNLEATQSAFKTANHTDLGVINTTLGSPFQAGGSIGNTSFIANAGTNLNTSALALDTSVNSLLKPASTLAAVTTLGSITSALPAGTNVIGHVITDSGSTTAVTGTVAVSGPLTDAQLRATPPLFKLSDASGTFLATVPISAASLPLPSGAATESTLSTKLTTINTTLGSPFQAGGAISNTAFIANAGTNLNTSLLALDSTVAKDASLTTINTSINTLLKPANTLAAVTTLGSITSALPTGANSIGQVTANAGTNLNTSALALDATLTNGTQKTKIVDGSGNVVSSTLVNAKQAIDVHQADTTFIVSGLTATGSAPTLNPVSVSGVDGGGLKRHLITDTSGRLVENVGGLSTDTLPSATANGSYVNLVMERYGRIPFISEESLSTRWGIMFESTTGVVSTGSIAEVPFFLLTNPNASGKNVRINTIIFTAPRSGDVLYNCYVDPTITANGTALSIVGGRQTNQATTVVTTFRSSTASANGTLFFSTDIASGNDIVLHPEFTRWVEANHKFMCTAIQSSSSQSVSGISIQWVEE